MKTVLVWFRRDLRLADNPALHAALKNSDRVIPVYVHAPHEEAPWEPGAASNWWLHHSLAALSEQLANSGAQLIIRKGDSLAELQRLIDSTDADAVYWNRLYEPAVRERDAEIKTTLENSDIEVKDFTAALLFEPGQVSNKSGDPFKVFTPFWKAALAQLELEAPLAPPESLTPVDAGESLPITDLDLLPELDWADGFADFWTPGEAGGLAQLDDFVAAAVGDYGDDRNRPDKAGTSRLSPHLHFGEISPRQVVWVTRAATDASPAKDLGAEKFLSEIGWREFAHHLLVHFPHTVAAPLRDNFEHFPWQRAEDQPDQFAAWSRGNTGIPLVDAGMRELWHTGWMHNRVRMVVASFLTKNQLISWQDGARWFWDTLVDADLASNTLGWQWTAGCGADAAPFFRIFNPVRQGEKFDPHERYVRQWCPELEGVPEGKAHEPWLADGTWPEPVVDLAASRKLALEAFQEIKGR